MAETDAAAHGDPTMTGRPYQRFRDATQSRRHGNGIAQRHLRARLTELSSVDRNTETTVTTAVTIPQSNFLTAAMPDTPPGADPLPGHLDRWLSAKGADLVAVRRHLHAHPEVSGQEFRTAQLIMKHLAEAGLAPRMLPARNGVICDIRGSDVNGEVVALRADLDALPLADTKDVPYRSTVEGVCHACGHDVHTAILLGAGLALAQLAARGELPGTVRLLFQPSEEAPPGGAPSMIAAGGLRDVAAIFGMHCAPQLPVGTVGVRSGPFTAATDIVEVAVHGAGGHTARPHLTADLVDALGRIVVGLPSLVNKRIDPRSNISVVFGAIHAGEAANTIPSAGYARATVRALSREAWRAAPDLITELVHEVAAPTGAKVEIDYKRYVPPVVNDRLATAVIAGAAAAALGPDRVIEAEVSMGGEDFAFYLEQVPGAMVRLGTGAPGATDTFDIHQGSFDVDERAIAHGVRVFVHTALAALATPAF